VGLKRFPEETHDSKTHMMSEKTTTSRLIMNFDHVSLIIAALTLTVLAGCGSKVTTQSVSFGPFTVQIADSYGVTTTSP
jgi:hypothetical protein